MSAPAPPSVATRGPGSSARRALVTAQWMGAALLALVTAVTMWPGHAFAAGATVTIPAGPFSDGQSITVSGVGFPSRAEDPSGLQILQCADPGGLAANLPVDATTCDGTTTNPLPVDTDSSGRFSTPFTVSALNDLHGTSNIDCDASDYCVLWVGEDYNQQFASGPHAFSVPFEVEAAASGSPTGAAPSTAGAGASVTSTTSAGSGTGSTTAAAATTATTAGTPSLATTGVPAGLPGLTGLGVLFVAVGTLGRRRLSWARAAVNAPAPPR